MILSKKQWLMFAGVALIVVAAGATWYQMRPLPGFPINPKDSIRSWTFKGAYTGNDTLITQANADMAHLVSLMGKGEFDDYDLYIGIGNDYNLEGNGKAAYDAYNRAITIHTDKGLAYANLGHLMDEIGAPYTAADAYAAAVKAEPGQLEYHIDRVTYLTRQFPEDQTQLLAAFTDASAQFGDTAPILAIEARWLTGLGRYADAIAAWQRAKLLSPGKDTTAIDTEIARLKAKQ
jgi:tetratricopeptide (TPR) repeat protein